MERGTRGPGLSTGSEIWSRKLGVFFWQCTGRQGPRVICPPMTLPMRPIMTLRIRRPLSPLALALLLMGPEEGAEFLMAACEGGTERRGNGEGWTPASMDGPCGGRSLRQPAPCRPSRWAHADVAIAESLEGSLQLTRAHAPRSPRNAARELLSLQFRAAGIESGHVLDDSAPAVGTFSLQCSIRPGPIYLASRHTSVHLDIHPRRRTRTSRTRFDDDGIP